MRPQDPALSVGEDRAPATQESGEPREQELSHLLGGDGLDQPDLGFPESHLVRSSPGGDHRSGRGEAQEEHGSAQRPDDGDHQLIDPDLAGGWVHRSGHENDREGGRPRAMVRILRRVTAG